MRLYEVERHNDAEYLVTMLFSQTKLAMTRMMPLITWLISTTNQITPWHVASPVSPLQCGSHGRILCGDHQGWSPVLCRLQIHTPVDHATAFASIELNELYIFIIFEFSSSFLLLDCFNCCSANSELTFHLATLIIYLMSWKCLRYFIQS